MYNHARVVMALRSLWLDIKNVLAAFCFIFAAVFGLLHQVLLAFAEYLIEEE